MSFLSDSGDQASTIIASAYGNVNTPIGSQIVSGYFFATPFQLPANYLRNPSSYVKVECAIRRSAVGFAPETITALWRISNNPTMVSQNSLCNQNIAPVLGATWRADGIMYGSDAPSNVVVTSTFAQPGASQTNTFANATNVSLALPIYINLQFTGTFDIGDSLDLLFYRITGNLR